MSWRLLSWLRRGLSVLRGNLLVLVASWVFAYFASSLVYPYESLYLQALGASPTVIGLVGSLCTGILCLVRVPGAYIADRYGRRGVIVVMSYGVALSYVLLALAPDWRLAALGMALLSLCLIYQPALEALTADSIPAGSRGLGYAVADVIPSIPAVAAPLVAGLLVDRYGFPEGVRVAYWLVVALMLCSATVRALWLEETLEPRPGPGPRSMLGELWGSLVEVVEAARRMPRSLAVLALVLAVSSFEEPIYNSYLPLYAVDVAGISEAEWASLNVIYLVVPLVAGIPLGKLVDVAGRRRALLAAHTVWTLAAAYLVYCRSLHGMILVLAALTAGSCLYRPAHQALLADLTPRETRGRVLGVVGTLNTLAMIPGSAIGGVLYEHDPAAPFKLSVILGIACITLITLLVEEPERREE